MTKLFSRILAFVVGYALVSAAFAQTAIVESVNSVFNKAQTYRLVSTQISTATAPTDVFIINGSATKTIYIKSIKFSGTLTTAAKTDVVLVKRSAVDSGGTAVTLTGAALDSTNSAATATAKQFTANATTIGAGVSVGYQKVLLAAPGTAAAGEMASWSFGDRINQYLTLRGVAQGLAINLSAAAVTGGLYAVEVEWMEL